MTDLILKKGKERSLLRRHPWVYDTAVQKLTGKAVSGDTVRVCSYDGRFLAARSYRDLVEFCGDCIACRGSFRRYYAKVPARTQPR